MVVRRVFNNKLARHAWLPQFGNNNSIPTIAGLGVDGNPKTFTYTPYIAKPESYHLAMNPTYLNRNAGESMNGYTPGRQASFIFNPEFLKGRASRLVDYTKADCEAQVDAFIQGKNPRLSLIVSGANEGYGSNAPFVQTMIGQGTESPACPQQYDWIDRRFVQTMATYGGRYYGCYDGHVYLIGATEAMNPTKVEQLRPYFSDGNAAFNFLKDNSGFGNPYLYNNAWQYRHGLINTYWAGWTDPHARMFMFLISFWLNRKALQAKGNTTSRTMSFMFPAKTEFTPHLQTYSHTVPSTGGHLDAYTFPTYAPTLNLSIAFLSMVMCDDVFGWEDTQLRGFDPNVIYNDLDGFYQYVGSGNPTRADSSNIYEIGRQYPYSQATVGAATDAMCEGIRWYSLAGQWAGWNTTFPRHKVVGAQNWVTTGDEYLLDRFLNNEPVVVEFATGSRRAIFIHNFYGITGSTPTDYEIDLGTSVLNTANIPDLNGNGIAPGIPYLFLIDQA